MTFAARTYLIAVLVFLYLPIAVLVMMGFNESPLYALPFQFTTHWYEALASNAKLLRSSWNSVFIALITSAIATSLGTLAAVALSRREFRGKTLLRLLLLPPIAIPWLITGTAMLVFFFWTGIGRGFHAILIGHVALAIPYVVLVVGTGLTTIRTDLEEAAMSLGSRPVSAFFRVTLPLLLPSIVGGPLRLRRLARPVRRLLLPRDARLHTLPVEIYSAIRKGFTPEINAICTILLGGSMMLFLLFSLFARPGAPRDRR